MKKELLPVAGLLVMLTINGSSYACIKEESNGEAKPVLQDTLSLKKARLAGVISGASALYIGSMAYLQYIWYKDHERVPFEFYNDLGGYNQIDKFGHIYGSYLESYIGFHSLLWAGVSRKKAVIIWRQPWIYYAIAH